MDFEANMEKHNSWSSFSSSVYSNEEETSGDVSPLVPAIRRNDSTYTTSSQLSTTSLKDPKVLGYTPFEYWQGPRPVAYPGDRKAKPRRLPPPRIKSPPPPMEPINSLRNFRPMPAAKLRDIKEYIDSGLADSRAPLVPPSPRVKDRYAGRYAERQRRRRERQRERSRLQRVDEWPGWVPDEKVVRRTASSSGEKGGRTRKVRVVSPHDKEKRSSFTPTVAGPPPKLHWWNPLSWRRRIWAILASILLLSVVAAVALSQLVATDNTPAKNYKRLTYRVAESYNSEDLYVSVSSTFSSDAPPRRMVARYFQG